MLGKAVQLKNKLLEMKNIVATCLNDNLHVNCIYIATNFFFLYIDVQWTEILQPAETIELTPSAPSQVPEQKTETIKSTFCQALGHNRKTCPSHQAQSWRIRKASMDAYGPYVESIGKNRG